MEIEEIYKYVQFVIAISVNYIYIRLLKRIKEINMARSKSSESKFRENRGIIDLDNPRNYIPWIKSNEFTKSEGTRYCISDMINGRPIHLMSGLEKDYYYITRWNNKVVEIFEQYPLTPISEVKLISEELGYKYPSIGYNYDSVVMTTDFLLLIKSSNGRLKWVARSIKPSSQLSNKRVLEKLKLEQIYWEKRNISWSIITEKNINKIKADNIQLISHKFLNSKNSKWNIELFRRLEKQGELNLDKTINLKKILSVVEYGDNNG